MTAEASTLSEGAATTAGSIQAIFATPVARMPHPGAATFNELIAGVVRTRIKSSGGLFDYKQETLTDMAGWGDPVIDKLTRWMLSCAQKMVETAIPSELETAVRSRSEDGSQPSALSIVVGNSWGSLYRQGDQHQAHCHPNTAITAIYYVQADGPCDLALLDPRPGIDYYDPGLTFGGASKNIMLHCSPGELILFPGWLWHAVPPFQGDGERISLSWNLDFVFRPKAPQP